MNFFEEKINSYYENFAFWALFTFQSIILSSLSPWWDGALFINGCLAIPHFLWHCVSCLYFLFACISYKKYFRAYYHLMDGINMYSYTASLSQKVAKFNGELF